MLLRRVFSTYSFASRHIGPSSSEAKAMLSVVGVENMKELIAQTVPKDILRKNDLNLNPGKSEVESLESLKSVIRGNETQVKNFLGMGYSGTITPSVVLRNVLEDPGWYTPYTPYQAEIAQGRLEMLLNYQTMVSDLTGLSFANASLLDEATAAAEAVNLCINAKKNDGGDRKTLIVDEEVYVHTRDVVKTRIEIHGYVVKVVPHNKLEETIKQSADQSFAVMLQYPGGSGAVHDLTAAIAAAKSANMLVLCASDLLALTALTPPGEIGVDACFGNSQRFGVPMGFGGPHAAFLATRNEFMRQCPGRVIGVSVDRLGNTAYRMSLQTREQHIRREGATSNICTAQALLATTATFYAIHHGPEGLLEIAQRVHSYARLFAELIGSGAAPGLKLAHKLPFFDTVAVKVAAGTSALALRDQLADNKINIRAIDADTFSVSFDETHDIASIKALVSALGGAAAVSARELALKPGFAFDGTALRRKSPFLTHPVFHGYRSESNLMRYMTHLRNRDYSLVHGMVPLGSCTMKLNAAAEMIPITWPEFNSIHPFAPAKQTQGYRKFIDGLERDLCEITGFDRISFQPNAGSQGEYAGIRAIRSYLDSIGQKHRDICIIPQSAHGTNPATAVMAGLKIAVLRDDPSGKVDMAHLKELLEKHSGKVAALMITYPSTYGIFSPITEIIDLVHRAGAQVYMDGANFNAQTGLCRPADFGADVCHLNLHKSFCIPHGGGGPGMGPIGVKKHLAPFLPSHTVVDLDLPKSYGAVSAAPYSSASILPISQMYITMMGARGLREATEFAILNANYMAKLLSPHYRIAFENENGRCAHEFILDVKQFKASAGVDGTDIAKRLQDYGFHAPTMNWPLPDSLMIEPTESESKKELDRLVDALIKIREEIRKIENGVWPKNNNPLKNAPHTQGEATATEWKHPYTREEAVYPAGPQQVAYKFWPTVTRVNDVFGDRNLVVRRALTDLPKV